MNNTKRQKKKKKRRGKGFYLAVFVIILYISSRIAPLLNASAQGIYIVEHGRIEKSIETVGYIAREEKVLASVGDGNIKYFVSEGERVAKGQKLAEIYLEQLDEESKKDLEAINLRLQNIKGKQNEQKSFKGDIEKIEKRVSNSIGCIQQDLKEGKYDRITGFKEELEELLDKKSIIAGEKSFSGKNIAQLERQKSQLENKINSSVQTIYSDSPGFVALGNDGLEELLNYKLLYEITGEQFELIKNNNSNPASEKNQNERPVIRIIENYKWSIVAEVDSEQVEGIKKGKNVKIRVVDQNKELEAVIRNIVDEGSKKIIIFDLDECIDDFHNIREITIEIILDRHEGAMIPNSSIVEKHGTKGVYIVDVNGVPDFVPIKIRVSNKEYSILYDGFFEQQSDNNTTETDRVKTIDLYDEVIKYGDRTREGRRIR